ncbi:hypothetical protein ACFWYW_11905 [Nonomuraea sp. NPDC059023]|uniref:phage integrase central domain-containing protein n=1 Tax=unclassified Nonomuraea TaxID=2593643 RepID=UPI00369CD855
MAYVKTNRGKRGTDRYTGMYREPKGEWVTEVVERGNGTTEKIKKLVHRYKSAGTFDSYDRALEVAKQMEEAADSLMGTDPKFRATVTLEEFIPIFLEQHRVTPNTKLQYRAVLFRHVVPLIGDFRVAELRRENIRRLLLKLEEDGAPASSMKVVRSALSALMKMARNDGYRDDNPVEGQVTPSFQRAPQHAWDMAMFNTFLPHLPNRPAKTYAMTQASVGARFGEMAALRVSDVNFVRARLAINKRVVKLSRLLPEYPYRLIEMPGTKTGKDREVDLGNEILRVLRSYIDDYGLSGDDLLFPAYLVTPKDESPRPTVEELMAACEALGPIVSPKTGRLFEHGHYNNYYTGRCNGPWCTASANEYSRKQRRRRNGMPVEDSEQPQRVESPYLDPDEWGKIFEAAAVAAGLAPIPMKNLRHTHAIALLDAGVSGIYIAKRLGHTREVLMEHYIVERPGVHFINPDVLDSIGIEFDFAS